MTDRPDPTDPEEIAVTLKLEARKETLQGRLTHQKKNDLEERRAKKQKTPIEICKKNNAKIKIVESDNEEEEVILQSNGSSDNCDVEIASTAFEELDKILDIEDYVLVEFAPENVKRKHIYYIGKLVSSMSKIIFEKSF